MKDKLPIVAVIILSVIVIASYISPISNWNSKQISNISVGSNYCFSVIGDINGDFPLLEDFLSSAAPTNRFVFVDGNFINLNLGGEYLLLSHVLNKINIPTIFVIGENEVSAGSSYMYRSVFGAPYFSFKIADTLFVVVDNSLGSVDVDQYNWLSNTLTNNSRRKIVIMNNPIINPWMSEYETPDGKVLDYLFKEKNVSLVVSSNDEFAVFMKDGVKYVNLGSNEKNVTYTRVCVGGNGLDVFIGHIERKDGFREFIYTSLIPGLFIICKALLLALVLHFSVKILRREFAR
ncbi:MAG: hypothetical protein J7K73_00120 [Nanoarchaeota archaeon]|nr:hypothetical protein [Nanoarchaeota archaeon]